MAIYFAIGRYQTGSMNQTWTDMINFDFVKPDFVEYYDSDTGAISQKRWSSYET